jgi:outer membrane protein assembly factor BamB
LLKVGDTKVIVAETEAKIVGVNAADGKLLWETPYAVGGGGMGGGGKGKGGGRGYNAASPMVDGETVLCVGSGRGVKAIKLEKKDAALEGKQLWSNTDNSVIYNTPVLKDGLLFGLSERKLFCIKTADGKTAWSAEIDGRQGYGNIVDAGAVLFAITPRSQLIAFEPSDKEFKEVAKYKVSDSEVYAYPVVAGNRIFVKDKDSVILWTIGTIE